MLQFHSREAATRSLQQECGGQPLTVEQNACREEIGSLTSPILRHRLAQELADACLESLFGNLAHWTPIDLERDILNVSKLIDVFNEMLEKDRPVKLGCGSPRNSNAFLMVDVARSLKRLRGADDRSWAGARLRSDGGQRWR